EFPFLLYSSMYRSPTFSSGRTASERVRSAPLSMVNPPSPKPAHDLLKIALISELPSNTWPLARQFAAVSHTHVLSPRGTASLKIYPSEIENVACLTLLPKGSWLGT